MSETKDPRRPRRRSSRTAGPPPAETVATEKLESGAADTGPAEKAAVADETTATTRKTEAVPARWCRPLLPERPRP